MTITKHMASEEIDAINSMISRRDELLRKCRNLMISSKTSIDDIAFLMDDPLWPEILAKEEGKTRPMTDEERKSMNKFYRKHFDPEDSR